MHETCARGVALQPGYVGKVVGMAVLLLGLISILLFITRDAFSKLPPRPVRRR